MIFSLKVPSLPPSLICIGGSLSGREFPLTETETVVGRDSKCDIPVQDDSMSRRHFALRPNAAGAIEIEDLDSHNGTFVNDVPIRRAPLAHQDRIQAGRSLFVLQCQCEAAEVEPSTPARAIQRDSPETKTSIRLPRAVSDSSARLRQRPARELAALLTISTAIQDLRAVEPLARQLLTSLREAMPEIAGSVVVLFHDGFGEAPWTLVDPPGRSRPTMTS